MKFDKPTLNNLRKEISDALNAIAKKNGMDSLTIGSMTYSDNKFTTRVTGISSKEAIVSNLPSNLSKSMNKEFLFRNDKYVVVEIKSNSPKFPVIAQNVLTKKKFKFPMSILDNVK